MSRSGYIDGGDCYDTEDWLRMCGWQANVRRCIRGRKGQAFMWELYLALEALPERTLIQGGLMDQAGACCALGAVARFRGIEPPQEFRVAHDYAPDEYEFQEAMGPLFGIKGMLAREIMFQNDDADDWHDAPGPPRSPRHANPRRLDSPEERWQRMRAWVVDHLEDIP